MIHTPGPWRVSRTDEPSDGTVACQVDTGRSDEGIAVYGWGNRTSANALLVAAAPELLGALEAIANEGVASVDRPSESEATAQHTAEAWDMLHWIDLTKEVARAAIAKARGEW